MKTGQADDHRPALDLGGPRSQTRKARHRDLQVRRLRPPNPARLRPPQRPCTPSAHGDSRPDPPPLVTSSIPNSSASKRPSTSAWSPASGHRATGPPLVSLVSGDATDHEGSVLSVDVDATYALARTTRLRQVSACIANVHSAFRSGSW